MKQSEQRNEIFRLYGRAAYQSQLLEEEILQLLLDQKWIGDTMPVETLEAEDKKLRKLTLGGLKSEFQRKLPTLSAFHAYLDAVKSERNYLAHHFFRDFAFHCDWGSTFVQEKQKLESILGRLEQCQKAVANIRKTLEEWNRSNQSPKPTVVTPLVRQEARQL